MKTVKISSVHLIYHEGIPIAFFARDEKSNENLIYMLSKASLDEISELFENKKEKI